MADRALMYEEDHYVLLVPGEEEEILTAAELKSRLAQVLAEHQDALPRDIAKFPTVPEQVNYLLNIACEFELSPGRALQWYAIRLEK